MVNKTYCVAACSRPATSEEQTIDLIAREKALDEAIDRGILSDRQVETHLEVLRTFEGYRRCTKDE